MRKRDYQKKNFRNPYFANRHKKKPFRAKTCLLTIFFLFILALFFNFGPWFKIKNIIVSGNSTVSQPEISQVIKNQLTKKRFLFFSQESIFFFNSSQVKKIIMADYHFDSLKVKKRFFQTIAVEIKEKTPVLVFISGDKKYYLDAKGAFIRTVKASDVVIETTSTSTQVIRVGAGDSDYLTVYDQSNSAVGEDGPAIKSDLINFILQLADKLKNNADFEVAFYALPSLDSDQLILNTVAGWQIYFKTNTDAQSQINRLFLILNQKIENKKNLQYIDLRFDDQVFYK